jgi:hypothetical protein
MMEVRDIVDTERNAAGKILREKLSCGHWVETAKRGLQLRNLKTNVLITKRSCKDCPPAAKSATPRVRPPKKPKAPSTQAPAPKMRRELRPSERISCPGCDGVFLCSAGCPVNRYGTWRHQDIKDAARKLAIKKSGMAEVAGPLAVPSQPDLLSL